MTVFWLIVAAFAVAALLFVAVPLFKRHRTSHLGGLGMERKLAVYRDQLAELGDEWRAGRLDKDQYAQARDELESRMLEELPDSAEAALATPPKRSYRAAALAASVAVPLVAIVIYLALGNPAAVNPQSAEVADGAAHGVGQQQLDAMIARLAARLEKNPQDANGWVMLARAQAVLGRFAQASEAYAKSVALVPDDAQLLADYADVLAMAHGQNLAGEPEILVERALRADPDNAKALALAGTIAFEKKDFALAVKHWQRLRGTIPPGSEFAESVQHNIDEANAAAGIGRQPGADPVTRTSIRK